MLSTSQRAPGYRFQYQVPPTPPPASNTRAEKPSPRRRCSMYIPAKPAPTTTASKTAPTSGARSGRGVLSAVMICVASPDGYYGFDCKGTPMKIVSIEDLHCDAGWRDFSFLKITPDDG